MKGPLLHSITPRAFSSASESEWVLDEYAVE
jgi:hypothetical protein